MTQQTNYVTNTPFQPIRTNQDLTQSLRVAKWLGMGIKFDPGHIVHLLDDTSPRAQTLSSIIEKLTPLQQTNPQALQDAIAMVIQQFITEKAQVTSSLTNSSAKLAEQSVQRKLFNPNECEDNYRKQAEQLGMDEGTVNAKIEEARLKRHPKNKMLQEIYDANQESPPRL